MTTLQLQVNSEQSS